MKYFLWDSRFGVVSFLFFGVFSKDPKDRSSLLHLSATAAMPKYASFGYLYFIQTINTGVSSQIMNFNCVYTFSQLLLELKGDFG